jgi:hypothetical protein
MKKLIGNCTPVSRRLSEIRLYALNGSTLNVARQIPFIQWSWLDQVPVIPNEILHKHLEIAKNSYVDVMRVNKNRGPYFELTGIWLGLEINKNDIKNAIKKFRSLPISHANSFLENMAIENFDNNHFRDIIVFRLGNTKTEKYWKYLFEIVEKNQVQTYALKPSLFSKIIPMKSQISQLLEVDD